LDYFGGVVAALLYSVLPVSEQILSVVSGVPVLLVLLVLLVRFL
jgi:hypothetical protein